MIISKKILLLAAGGLVENEKGQILFMFRRGKWDLPKGKLDPGETLEECALREVTEETGVERLELRKFLLQTLHEYEELGKVIQKKTHWFHMAAASHQTLVPQTEEDITELRWIAPENFEIVLRNTYPAIVEVLRAGGLLV
jgi:8-oxo-dGTP pyrophosphatase MutT (NUDIX family)